jgi:hypothetical protein
LQIKIGALRIGALRNKEDMGRFRTEKTETPQTTKLPE